MMEPYLKCYDGLGRVVLLNPSIIHCMIKNNNKLFALFFYKETRKYERFETTGQLVDGFSYLSRMVDENGCEYKESK